MKHNAQLKPFQLKGASVANKVLNVLFCSDTQIKAFQFWMKEAEYLDFLLKSI